MRRACLAVLFSPFLVLGAACGGGSGGGTPTPTPPPGATMTASELALAMDCLTEINSYRATQALPPFAWYARGADAAYGHCLDMEANAFFDHTSPTTGTPAQRAQAAGISHDVPGCLEPGTFLPCQGENLAYGLNANLTGLDVTNGWIGSPGHHAQLVAPNAAPGAPFTWPAWTHAGIAVRVVNAGGNTTVWWTAMFFRNPTP